MYSVSLILLSVLYGRYWINLQLYVINSNGSSDLQDMWSIIRELHDLVTRLIRTYVVIVVKVH